MSAENLLHVTVLPCEHQIVSQSVGRPSRFVVEENGLVLSLTRAMHGSWASVGVGVFAMSRRQKKT